MTATPPDRRLLDQMTDDDLDRLRDRLAAAEARVAELDAAFDGPAQPAPQS